MAKNMTHYFKDGTKHPGGTHKMPNGDLHSGSKHGTASKKLYHYAELPSASAKKKEEHSEDSTLIQGTESQVRGRHFNNNDGKGTF
jgi:hypothetical protein